MQQLVKLTANSQGEQVVSAKELYDFLGFDSTHWKRWYKKNIENNPFAIEGQDWEGFAIMANGNETKDFVLSLDFAKRISQMARTAKGEEVRNYFIGCEAMLQNIARPKLPDFNNPAEAARAWANEYEQRQLAEHKNENLQIGLDNLLSWVSIIKVAQRNRVKETCFNWRVLKRKSHEMGYDVKRTESGRFDYQNLYHVDVFRVCYPQYKYDFKVREY